MGDNQVYKYDEVEELGTGEKKAKGPTNEQWMSRGFLPLILMIMEKNKDLYK